MPGTLLNAKGAKTTGLTKPSPLLRHAVANTAVQPQGYLSVNLRIIILAGLEGWDFQWRLVLTFTIWGSEPSIAKKDKHAYRNCLA